MKKLFYILSLLVATQVVAQTPQAINYQAVATNTSGVAIANTNIGVRISILAGSTTGTNVYTETHTATTSANGIFNVEIGRGNVQSGNFPNIQWYAQPHFAKIDIDINGGTNYQTIGTTQFLSVPYALFAENVAMLFRVNDFLPFNGSGSSSFRNDTLYIYNGSSYSSGASYIKCDILDWLGGEPEQITISATGFNSNIKFDNITFPYILSADLITNENNCGGNYSFSISNTTPVGIYPITITATNPRGRQKSKTQYVNVLPCNNSNENDVVGRYEGFYSDSLFYSDTIQIYNYTNNDGIINIYINNLRTIINCNKIGDTFTGTFTNRNFSFLNEDYNWISVNNSSGVINGTICAGKLNLTISFASGSLSSIYTGVTSFSGKVVSGVFFIKQ